MNSRIYSGTVMHERFGRIRNRFSYGIYFLLIDMDEVEELADRYSTFAHNGRGKISLWDQDHGPRDGSPLKPWIIETAAQAGVDLEGGRVMLLTFPRVAGFKFFPVSFWYCYSSDGTLRVILAEVQNTYRDRHNYLIHADGQPLNLEDSFPHNKVFFVSPFIPIDGVGYTFRFTEPSETLRASITDRQDSKPVLVASIDLASEELTDASIHSVVKRLGAMSLRAQVLIYWQAVRLLFKGAKVHDHVPPPEEETTL